MKTLTTTVVLALAGATGVAQAAENSSLAEIRGYELCVNEAERNNAGLTPSRHYFIQQRGNDAQYFINAHRWSDVSQREAVRLTCETSARGRKLVSNSVEPGRYVLRDTEVRVEVAAK